DRQQLRVSEYIDDNVATAPITVAKGLDDRLIAAEGGFCRLLRNGGSAGGDGLLQARCDRRQLVRAHEPAEPPSGHGIGLGKPRNHEGAVRGPERADRDVAPLEDDVFVQFVTDDIDMKPDRAAAKAAS